MVRGLGSFRIKLHRANPLILSFSPPGKRDAAGAALPGNERNGPKGRPRPAGRQSASSGTNGHSRQWHGKLSETK